MICVASSVRQLIASYSQVHIDRKLSGKSVRICAFRSAVVTQLVSSKCYNTLNNLQLDDANCTYDIGLSAIVYLLCYVSYVS